MSTVAAAQAKAGDRQAARRSFAEAAAYFESAREMDPSDYLLNANLSEMAGLQAEAGFAATATKTALNTQDGQLRVEALISVARHLAGKPPPPWWKPRPINFFWPWD